MHTLREISAPHTQGGGRFVSWLPLNQSLGSCYWPSERSSTYSCPKDNTGWLVPTPAGWVRGHGKWFHCNVLTQPQKDSQFLFCFSHLPLAYLFLPAEVKLSLAKMMLSLYALLPLCHRACCWHLHMCEGCHDQWLYNITCLVCISDFVPVVSL